MKVLPSIYAEHPKFAGCIEIRHKSGPGMLERSCRTFEHIRSKLSCWHYMNRSESSKNISSINSGNLLKDNMSSNNTLPSSPLAPKYFRVNEQAHTLKQILLCLAIVWALYENWKPHDEQINCSKREQKYLFVSSYFWNHSSDNEAVVHIHWISEWFIRFSAKRIKIEAKFCSKLPEQTIHKSSNFDRKS